MLLDAELSSNVAGGVSLPRMPLAVMDRKCVEREPVGFGDRAGRVRIEAAAQEQYRSQFRRPAPRATRCTYVAEAEDEPAVRRPESIQPAASGRARRGPETSERPRIAPKGCVDE